MMVSNDPLSAAWRLLDSEKAEHAKTKAEFVRLRAALEHIAADGAISPASYARHVLEGGKP